MNYQLSIRTRKREDQNSAASKAVHDCNTLFSRRGYKDYSIVLSENKSRLLYYPAVLKAFIRFYFAIEKGALVGVQYPMLNKVFKYFIRVANRKKIKFFCLVHDVESLRLGGMDDKETQLEAGNFNYYDCLIVHNTKMLNWLKDKGTTVPMVSLGMFDYLSEKTPIRFNSAIKTVSFAGNLSKSSFIYLLESIPQWNFNVYGPNFQFGKVKGKNVKWGGEFSPEAIVTELTDSFGLIWDGTRIDTCDEIIGNYLLYNNPHKFSLYLAAGLPVIAPANSAISTVIKEHRCGILLNSLTDLSLVEISEAEYGAMKSNCLRLSSQVRRGDNFLTALDEVESQLSRA